MEAGIGNPGRIAEETAVALTEAQREGGCGRFNADQIRLRGIYTEVAQGDPSGDTELTDINDAKAWHRGPA